MGGIVKSIGRALKKLGKSVGKFLKKYKTTIILAAAIWAGLGAFGASESMASIWSPASVKAGISRIFTPAATTPARWATDKFTPGTIKGTPMKTPGAPKGGAGISAKELASATSTSTNVLSAIGKWFGGMPEWGKYALTQTGMTIVGSMLDTSAEEELAARYGGMGIPYGSKIDDPTAIFKEHPEWAVQPPPSWPAAPTTSQTSTPQQAQLTRAPATVGKPRSQQIAAMRTMPLDVRPPGMISGRSAGLIPMGASQRRYA